MKANTTRLACAVIAVLSWIASTGTSFAGTLDLSGVDRTVTDITDVSGYDELTNSSETLATLTFNLADGVDTAYAGVISGNIKLVMAGSKSKLTLSGANTYTGGTSVEGGVIVIANKTACGDSTKSVVLESFDPSVKSTAGPWCALQFDVSDFANPITLASGTTAPSWYGNTHMSYNLCVTNADITVDSQISGGYFALLATKTFTKESSKAAGPISFNGPVTCTGMRLYTGEVHFKGAVTNSDADVTGAAYSLMTKAHFHSPYNKFNGTSMTSQMLYAYAEADGVFAGLDAVSFTQKKSGANQSAGILYLQGNSVTLGRIEGDGPVDVAEGSSQVVDGGSGEQSVLTMQGDADTVCNHRFIGNMDLVWDPSDAYTFTATSNRVSSMVGKLEIKGGTFELDGGHTMLGVTNITIASGATLKISTEGALSSSVAIEAESGVTLDLAADVTVATFKLGGKYLQVRGFSAGTYRSGALTVTGEGSLYVATKPGVEETYTWTGGGSDAKITTAANWADSTAPDFDTESPFVVFAGGASATLDRNVTLSGITFDGPASFELSASGSYVLSLGAGGISNAPAASAASVVVSAPIMPLEDQVWQMDTNVTFTLSGVLRQYGTATPTITVRQSSTADPVINFAGAATPEAAGDFAGDIVFEKAVFSGEVETYGTACIRASGYEPFGPSGTVTIEGLSVNAAGSGDEAAGTYGRYPVLYLTNAVISKAFTISGSYASVIAADANSTNVLNGEFTLPGRAPHFQVASGSELTVKSDIKPVSIGGGTDYLRFMCKSPDGDGSGRVVFDGAICPEQAGGVRILSPLTVEFNAVSNSISEIRDVRAEYRNKTIYVIFGVEDAFPYGSVEVHPLNNAPMVFDLKGNDQYFGTVYPGMSDVKFVSSAGVAVMRVNQTTAHTYAGTVGTNVVFQKEGSETLTFSHTAAFEAGSTLVVSNGAVVAENSTALNKDVDLKLLGGTISVPSGTTAEVGHAWYDKGDGTQRDLARGEYGPGSGILGSHFAAGSGSIFVTKGRPGGFFLIFR